VSTPFDRPLYGYRFVQTDRGDTLQRIAARFLGDAERWTEIIVLNDMVPPYLTDDPAKVASGVFLNGSTITIPASAPSAQTSDPNAVFGQDILLINGNLSAVDGDLQLVGGLANLDQALEHLLDTDQGELMFHPEYGTLIRTLIGSMNGPTAMLLAAEYAKEAIATDLRIDSVTGATGTASFDAIEVVVDAMTIQGATTSAGATY